MNKMKKIGALLLAVMMVAVVAIAGASGISEMKDSNPTGVIGDFEAADTPVSGITESVKLQKELVAYNGDNKYVYSPVMSYSYTIAGATAEQLGNASYKITDSNDESIHANETSVTVTVKPGVTGATITSTVEWTNVQNNILAASSNGTSNYKDITVDFSKVNFGAAGVYRYVITEKPGNKTDATEISTYYTEGGVTETNGTHIRYLDVYVKPSANYTGNGGADDWDVYGYVCTYANNNEITATSKTASNVVKTTGFVSGQDQSGNNVKADSYYTYNLTISKEVVNDSFAKATHYFPFSVIFGGSSITRNIKLDDEAGTGVTNFDTFITSSAPTWSNVLKIKDVDGNSSLTELDAETAVNKPNNSITFVGIPVGVDVEVYETNDVSGVTYQVLSTRTNATTQTGTDASVTDGTTPTGTQTKQAAEKPAYQSTKTTFDTTAVTTSTAAADVTNYLKGKAIDITNTLLLISPTGYVSRYAPYALILIAGIVLLIVAKKRKPAEEE